MHSGTAYLLYKYCTNSFVHAENIFRRVHCRTRENAASYPLQRLQAHPLSSCLTQNSVGLRRPRFPTTMLSLSWMNLPNISISGLINPRSENIVQILVATSTLPALLPRSFYFQSILCDRLNLRPADPHVYDFHSPFYISFRC